LTVHAWHTPTLLGRCVWYLLEKKKTTNHHVIWSIEWRLIVDDWIFFTYIFSLFSSKITLAQTKLKLILPFRFFFSIVIFILLIALYLFFILFLINVFFNLSFIISSYLTFISNLILILLIIFFYIIFLIKFFSISSLIILFIFIFS
jgi:hypothetical protein